jgi:hypothetical protein
MTQAANLAALGTNAGTTGVLTSTAMPAGSVLQVVNATYSTAASTTSTSFVTTGFSVSITPKFVTSKVLVIVNGGGGLAASSNVSMYCTIYRASTNLGDATYGLSRLYAGSSSVMSPHSMSVLDSPATTSSTTYTCYYKAVGGTVDFMAADRGVISFIAMEIAA